MSSTELPEPGAHAASVVTAVVEVLAGTRPPGQLLRWLSADVFATVQRRAVLANRSQHRRAPARRATVRRVSTSSPRGGVVEAAVVVQDARRVRAVALRLEALGGRWRVTALELGPTSGRARSDDPAPQARPVAVRAAEHGRDAGGQGLRRSAALR